MNGKGVSYPGLLHTLEREFGDTFDAERRIWTLEWHQIQRFFAWRLRIPDDPSEKPELVEVPKSEDKLWHFDAKEYPACAYYIDEAHEFFQQADWQKIGSETQSWASQNRRTGDEAWLFTQQAELVAKPFRRQSVECIYFVNWGHRRVGWFKAPNRIRGGVYVKTPPGESDQPLHRIDLTFQKSWLNGIYDTASGAGVRGAGADMGKRPKGVAWQWIPAGFVVFMCLLFVGVKGCFAGLNAVSNRVKLGGAVVPAQAMPAPAATGSRGVFDLGGGPHGHPAAVPEVRLAQQRPEPKVVGRLGSTLWFDDHSRRVCTRIVDHGSTLEADGHLYEWGH